MSARRFRRADDGASAVLGTILVLGVLSGAILYVNVERVPEKGAEEERRQSEQLGAALDRLAATLSAPASASDAVTVSLPFAPAADSPSLLRGVILDPARPAATLELDPVGARIRVWHETPSGVIVNDVGAAGARQAVGRLLATTDGRYIEPATFLVELGAALHGSDGSYHTAQPPPWGTTTQGAVATVRLVVPRMLGEPALLSGSDRHTASLLPEVEGGVGPAPANRIGIEIESRAPSAWGAFLNRTFAPATAVVSPASGLVTIVLLPAAGETLRLDLRYAEFLVRLS